MIVVLNPRDEQVAAAMLDVQIPAYEAEAELIQFDGIPQLRDTIETLGLTEETFIGWMAEGELTGFLSYQPEAGDYTICRLVVHPKHTRKGIASALLEHFLTRIAKKCEVSVSTGEANLPAKRLYGRFGFRETGRIKVAPDVWIVSMVKKGICPLVQEKPPECS